MTMWTAVAALALQVAAPSVQPGVPAPGAIAAHVGDCVAATSAAGIDLATFDSRGWNRGEARGSNGVRMALFAKAGDMTLVSATTAGPDAGACMVLSPVVDAAGLEAVLDALESSLTVPRTAGDDAETSWMTPTHRVTLARMGNARVRGVRIIVRSRETE